jgi:hypothetical protein
MTIAVKRFITVMIAAFVGEVKGLERTTSTARYVYGACSYLRI